MPEAHIALKPIPDYPGYFAGSDGTIRSLWGKGVRRIDLNKIPFILSPGKQSNGKYLCVTIRRFDGRIKTNRVHRLVCAAFHGVPSQDNLEVFHEDGNDLNCRPDNLRWRTRSSNHQLKKIHGTDDKGLKNSRSVIKTKERLNTILSMLSSGKTRAEIARTIGVSRITIIRIAQGKRYVA